MYRQLLVPLDGSALAEQALPVALDLARREGASVELALVHETELPITRAEGAPVRDPRFEHDMEREQYDYLERVAHRLREPTAPLVTTAFLRGRVVDALAAHAEQGAADLIVMTTHGRGGASLAWLGSVADGLLRRVAKPILLCRTDRQASTDGSSAGFFRRVLLPLDGSELAEEAISRAVQLAGRDGVEYTLLEVISPVASLLLPSAVMRGDEEIGLKGERETPYLVRMAADLRSRGYSATARESVHAKTATGILLYAERMRADLIALTSRGRGRVGRLVLGSVADKVMRGAATSVLVCRSGESQGITQRHSDFAAIEVAGGATTLQW